jgi:hypothetical protein
VWLIGISGVTRVSNSQQTTDGTQNNVFLDQSTDLLAKNLKNNEPMECQEPRAEDCEAKEFSDPLSKSKRRDMGGEEPSKKSKRNEISPTEVMDTSLDEKQWVFIKKKKRFFCYLVEDNPNDTVQRETGLNQEEISAEEGIRWIDVEKKKNELLLFENIQKTNDYWTYKKRVEKGKIDTIYILEMQKENNVGEEVEVKMKIEIKKEDIPSNQSSFSGLKLIENKI